MADSRRYAELLTQVLRQVVIEENNFESIVADLVAAGIAEDDIVSADDVSEVDRTAA